MKNRKSQNPLLTIQILVVTGPFIPFVFAEGILEHTDIPAPATLIPTKTLNILLVASLLISTCHLSWD